MNSRALVIGAIWFCFFAKAIFYASFMPLWEGVDEYAHFAFVEYLDEVHKLPPRDAGISREVAESLRLAPVPWTVRSVSGWLPHDDFWRLPPEERMQRQTVLRALPREPAHETEARTFESQQPPLAYLLFWIVWRPLRDSGIGTRVWILRIAGAVIASAAIPLVFLIAKRVFGSPWRAVGITAIFASMPQLLLNVAHVSNEALAVFMGTACTLILISLPDRADPPMPHALLMGVVFGLSLLTKAYFLALIPAIAAVYIALWIARREHRRPIALHAAITASVTVAIAGWWYARNIVTTGTISGEIVDVASRQSGRSFADAFVYAKWLHTLDFAAISYIWLGGWSFLIARTWMYRAIELLLAAALVGLVVRLVRPRQDVAAGKLAICAALAGFFWIAPFYQAMVTYRARGVAETMGYYAYCLAAAEVVCLAVGTTALLPGKRSRFAVPAIAACFALLEIYGVVFLMMPYYAGFTGHSARGSVPAMHLGMLAGRGFHRLFENLAAFKPIWMSGAVLAGLWAGFMLAAVGIIAIAFYAASRERERTAA